MNDYPTVVGEVSKKSLHPIDSFKNDMFEEIIEYIKIPKWKLQGKAK